MRKRTPPDVSKPLSLRPLSLEEAVKTMLQVKPFSVKPPVSKRKPSKSASKRGAS